MATVDVCRRHGIRSATFDEWVAEPGVGRPGETSNLAMSAAADQIRYGGLESTSAGNFMKSADLMHGGFYGHFASRADLPAQALKNARWLMVRVDPQCGN